MLSTPPTCELHNWKDKEGGLHKMSGQKNWRSAYICWKSVIERLEKNKESIWFFIVWYMINFRKEANISRLYWNVSVRMVISSNSKMDIQSDNKEKNTQNDIYTSYIISSPVYPSGIYPRICDSM